MALQNKSPKMLCPVAQSVASLTADPGVARSIPTWSNTFEEIFSTIILFLPLNHSRRIVVSYKRKYEQEVLVNRLVKLAHEKVSLGELTIPTS